MYSEGAGRDAEDEKKPAVENDSQVSKVKSWSKKQY